jgi:hypothetical protein
MGISVSCGRVLLFALSVVYRDNHGFQDHNPNNTFLPDYTN